MLLTDAEIKALKPKAVRYLKSDGRGLSLDVLPSNKMSWMFRYRLKGKQERVTIGEYPTLTLRAARAKRDQLAAQVAQGESPAAQKKKARRLAQAGLSENPTVREFGEVYYAEQIVPNWKNPLTVRRYLDVEIYPALGQKVLRDVNALDVQALVYRKRDGGHAQSAIQLRGVIKRLFDYALEKQLVKDVNPAVMVARRYIGKARKRERNLKPEEIRLYLRTVYQSNIRRQFKLALHLLLLTCMRKSTLLLARKEEINFETGEWTIPPQHMKGKKGEEREHIVYMSAQVAALFRELMSLAGDSELVLPGRGSLTRPFAANALNKALEGLTFDMDPVTIHDLRRTASTLLRENGWAKEIVEKALSHEEGGVSGIYNRAEYARERKKMLQWWADYVDSIVTESKVIVGNFGAA